MADSETESDFESILLSVNIDTKPPRNLEHRFKGNFLVEEEKEHILHQNNINNHVDYEMVVKMKPSYKNMGPSEIPMDDRRHIGYYVVELASRDCDKVCIRPKC